MTTTNADRTVAVFAATGAIGRAAAHELARQGAHVWVSGRDAGRTEDVATEIAEAGGKATPRPVDATDAGAINAHLDEVLATDGQLHAVVNAIGDRPEAYRYPAPSDELALDDFLLPIREVAGSQFLTGRSAATRMAAHGGGSVVMLSAVLSATTAGYLASITAACGAVEAMARSLAGEYGSGGVRVNTVRANGMPDTRTIRETMAALGRLHGVDLGDGHQGQQTALGRPLTLDDTARSIAWLASPASDGVAAQTINVCTGQYV